MPTRLLIDRPEQLEAIASPARNQIALALEMAGASSVSEIGRLTGRTPESLYYHLRRLEKVGVVERRGERPTSGRPEAVYALRGDRVVVDQRQRSPRFLRAYVEGAATFLRYMERCLRRACRSSDARRAGAARNVRIHQVHVRLSRSALVELNKRLDEALEAAEDANSPTSAEHCVITVAVSPVALSEAD